jgi:predicted amidohydrolase YtcJ
MKAKIVKAHALGFQVGIHAIGDAAIDLILDAYEEAQRQHPRPDARHRIEHCSIVDLETIRRIKRLGVIPIPGTSFLYHFRDAYLQNLGPERMRYAYAMRTFADEGVIAAASTDAPVVPVSAAVGLGMMMHRVDANGVEVWPEERVSLEEAVRAYSWNGAYASFEERIKGSLEHGKVGDVTVFDADLRTLSPAEIGEATVELTITDGRVVFERSTWGDDWDTGRSTASARLGEIAQGTTGT